MAEAHKGRVGFEDTFNFTNSLCVAYTLCSAILRGWIRRDIYGIDDVVIAAATLTTLGFFAANYVALEHSAGKPWSYIEDAHDVASFDQVCSFKHCTNTPQHVLSLTDEGINGIDSVLHNITVLVQEQCRGIPPAPDQGSPSDLAASDLLDLSGRDRAGIDITPHRRLAS